MIPSKSTMSFRLEHFNLVKPLLEDEKDFNNCSQSVLIENILLDHYLTSNKTLDTYIKLLYSEYENSIGFCMSEIFRENISGLYDLQNLLRDEDYKSLLKFCYKNSRLCRFAPLKLSDEIFHCEVQFDSVIKQLEKDSENENEDLSLPVRGNITLLKQQFNNLKECQGSFSFSICFNSVYECWDLLKKYPFTFKFLMDLCLLEKRWNNIANSRYQLLQIIKGFELQNQNNQ